MTHRSADDLVRVEWNPPLPRELPGIREDLVESTMNPLVHLGTARMLAAGRGTITLPEIAPDTAATILLSEERTRLAGARLYSLTDEMTHVSIAAGKKLPSYAVHRDDVPSTCGLMMFGEPIGNYRIDSPDGSPRIVSIVAASWGPTQLVQEPAEHLWVTFWSLVHHDVGIRAFQNSGLSLRDARKLQYSQGDYCWDNEVLLTYDQAEVRVATADGESTVVDPSQRNLTANTTIEWIQTVRAAWLLMKQKTQRPVADVADEPLSKTVRRQLRRKGYNDDPIRVVTLHHHRQTRTTRERPSGYTVTVRSKVEGHVRWQPYRSRGVIEPIWIDDHVRGPKDAPWSPHQTTVTVVDRPPGGRPPGGGK